MFSWGKKRKAKVRHLHHLRNNLPLLLSFVICTECYQESVLVFGVFLRGEGAGVVWFFWLDLFTKEVADLWYTDLYPLNLVDHLVGQPQEVSANLLTFAAGKSVSQLSSCKKLSPSTFVTVLEDS